jgi:uncharacterized lipoprotein YajG
MFRTWLGPALLAACAHAAEKPPAVNPAPVVSLERVVTSVVPSLDYGAACWSTLALTNLSDRIVTVEVEPHREGGGLVGLAGLTTAVLHLNPGERSAHRLEITDESGQGWLKVRERVPSPKLAPAIAVSAVTECTIHNQLISTPRQISYPTRNPWFSGDIEEMHGSVISLVNTSEREARASLCYSEGNLYSVPTPGHPSPELSLVCSSAFDVQIPPYAARQFPVEHEGSTHFAIKTQGDEIVLQMLKPVESGVKVYKVDSSITFGGEVGAGK